MTKHGEYEHISPEQLGLMSGVIKLAPFYGRPSQIDAAQLFEDSLRRLGWDDVMVHDYTTGEIANPDLFIPVEELGLGDEYFGDTEKPKRNVYGILHGDKRNDGPTLILNGHFDIEPVSDPRLWSVDPASGEIINGRMYGRGSTDMLAGLTSTLFVASQLAKRRKEWGGKIIFMAVVDEEIGGNGTLAGIEKLTRDGIITDPSKMMCLIGEPTSGVIADESRGFMHARFSTKGVARHLAESRKSDNALYGLIDLIQRFEDDLDSIRSGIDPNAETFRHNFGIIKGGIDAATPMDKAVAEATIFYPPIVERLDLQRRIAEAYEDTGVNVDFSRFYFDGHKTKTGALHDSLVATRNPRTTRTGYLPSPCDARLFDQMGVREVIVYGPGSISQAHAVDENIKISDINAYNRHLAKALGRLMRPR